MVWLSAPVDLYAHLIVLAITSMTTRYQQVGVVLSACQRLSSVPTALKCGRWDQKFETACQLHENVLVSIEHAAVGSNIDFAPGGATHLNAKYQSNTRSCMNILRDSGKFGQTDDDIILNGER